MSNFKKILIILLLTIPILITTGYSAWVVINMQENDTPPDYNYEEIVKEAYDGQNKDYTGNGLGPDSKIKEELIDSETYTFEYYDESTSQWIKGWPVDSGTYKVRVINKYDLNSTGVEITFVINKASQGVSVTQIDVIYDGQSHQIDENSITVNPGNKTDGAIIISGNIPRSDVGETVVTIKVLGNDNYNEYNSTVSIIVKAKDIASADVVAQVKTNYVYDGTKKEPSYADLLLTYNGMTLNDNNDYSDYIVTGYGENINATNGNKTASVTIKGIGNYTGTKTIYFDIAKADQTPSFTTFKTYDGLSATVIVEKNTSITAEPLVTFYNQNYQVIDNPRDVALNGTKYYFKLSIAGNNNYNDYNSDYIEYTINPLDLNNEIITFGTINDIKCTGEELTLPKPIVKFGEVVLTENSDYTVSYYTSSNVQVTKIIEAGTYKVRVTGKGNFSGNYDIQFNVVKNQITDATIKVTSETYTSNAITPIVTIIYNEKQLQQNKDFTLTYDIIVDAGEYVITIEGIGIFEGETTATLVVNKADFANVTISISDVAYSGTYINVLPIVTFNGNEIDNSNYSTEIYQNSSISVVEKVGSYEMKFTGSKNFTGTNSKIFNVTPRDLSEVTLNVPSTTYNGKNQEPVVYASYNGNQLLVSDYDVTYEYSEFVNANTYTLTLTGKNNLKGSVEVTYTINKLELTNISLDNMTTRYDGNSHTLLITGKLPDGVSVTYENNVQTEIGNYTVSATITDTTGNYIVPPTLTATLSITDKDEIKVELLDTIVTYDCQTHSVDMNFYDVDDILIEDQDLIDQIKSCISLTFDGSTTQPVNVKLSGQNVVSYEVLSTLIENNNFNLIFKEGTDDISYLTINQYTLTNENVDEIIESFVYDGSKKEPEVTIRYNEMVLSNTTDYSVYYGTNTEVSTGGVVGIKGKGNYTGELTVTFAISPATITLSDSDWATINPFVEGMIPTLSKTTATINSVAGNFKFADTSAASSVVYEGTSETCTGTLEVSFIPTSSNYQSVTTDISYTMYAVAYIGSTYYGTIKNAVDSANSGNKVYVVHGLKTSTDSSGVLIPIPVTETITIPNNISVYVTYDGTNYVDSDYSSLSTSTYADSSTTNISKYRQTLINLSNGADIIINEGGSLYLGGQTHRIGVTGNYCEINLDVNSMIDCSGSFYCFGYVKENSVTAVNGNQTNYTNKYDNSYDAERMIRVNSSGYLMTIISIYASFSDIATLKGYNDVGVFPFPKFDFPNLQTYTEINSGGTFTSKCFIVAKASSLEVPVNEEMKVVGTTDGMFKLSSGNIAFEYCSTSNVTTSTEGKTRIYINGELSQGYVEIKVYTETVTTNDKFIPLSYKFNVYINDGGIYSCSKSMKFLPGSILKINKGGQLIVDSDLLFYEGSEASKISGYTNKTNAILINNGTIKVTANGRLGAFIETEVTDGTAKLDFSEVTVSESFTTSATEGETAVGVARTSSGIFIDSSDEGKSVYQFKAGSIVYSDANGNACWDGEKYALRTLNIIIDENDFEKEIFSYQVFSADSANGENSVDLTSGFISNAKPFELVDGKYVRIVIKRHNGAVFDNGTIHDSTVWYKVDQNLNLIITPSEGIKLTVKQDGTSGAGYTTFTVYECPTQNGEYYEIANYPGLSTETTYIVKGWYFKITYEEDALASIAVKTELDKDNFTLTPVSGAVIKPFKDGTAYQLTVESTVHFPRKEKGNCLAEGTLITMADGTKKKVENILPGDLLIVYNHETGKYETAEVLFNDSELINNYVVVNLEFSNGSNVRVIAEHGFFDLDLMKYVYIDEYNYMDYVGHRFVASTYVDGEVVQSVVTLDNAFLTEEYIRVYSPVTKYHMNYITEDILSMPGGIEGLFNIFEYDDNLQYNEEQMQKDIETYGLFTYEDFKDLVSYEVYCSFPTAYFKVALGKGILTWEDLEYYIARYAPLV